MAYVLIEHRVGDFETFKQVYRTTPSAARASAPRAASSSASPTTPTT